MGGAWVRRIVVGVGAAVVLAAVLGVPAASAEALSPWWGVTSGSQPTNLVSGETGRIVVTAEDRGDASTSGEVVISDRLPAGLEATGIEALAGERPGIYGNRGPVSCVLATLTCTFGDVETEGSNGEEVPETLSPYEEIEVDISVTVGAGAVSGEQNTAGVSGGGAASAVSASDEIEVDGSERFGVEDFQLVAENAGGSLDTQAGSHPFQLTSVVTLNTTTPEADGGPRTVALPRDLSPALPAGLTADSAALPRCSEAQFDARERVNGQNVNACPADSAVGVATVTFDEPVLFGFDTVTTPIFDLESQPGDPARFAIKALGLFTVSLEASIRSGADYGVTLAADNIASDAQLLSLKLTFWGVPGDQRHDTQRGWACLEGAHTCTPAVQASSPPVSSEVPFLSLPAACGVPLRSELEGDSWRQEHEQGGRLYPLASAEMGALAGCTSLPFEPEIEVTPEVRQASSPSGFAVDVHVPGEGAEDSEGTVGSSVRDVAVELPEGVALNPSVANGQGVCSESQVGFTGLQALDPQFEPGAQTAIFTSTLPELWQQGTDFCANASKLGSVQISTALLAGPLQGAVYLASPQSLSQGPPENPFSSLLAVYVIAEEPISGVIVKLAGRLTADPASGRLTVSFEQLPQLQIENIDLAFFGGERAPLSTPARCGSYATDASFVPWSATLPGGTSSSGDEVAVTVHTSSTFEITTGQKTLSEPGGGAGGSPCPGASLPFAPSMTAGTTSLDAGEFSPLIVTIGREDGQQALSSVRLSLPSGLSAILAGVRACGEAQANAGTCPAESEIGQTTLSAGLGEDPYTIAGGKVYLTEKYEGASFGLAIAVPTHVGPFTLQEGRPIVVRAKLEINPATAALTIATGAIPSIVEGIPLQIKLLNIVIDRPGFILNATSCDRMSIAATVAGGEGAIAAVSETFQLANCASLKFAPKFAVSTSGKTSRANGASLHVKLTYPSGALGKDANIAKVKVDLPKQLVSRLATLQGACLASVFDQNPAACPATSRVGTANATTPVLPAPRPGRDANLIGPAYFVSHGGVRFPELVVVLQGDGVTVDLHGEMFIDNAGVTSSTFRTIPDVPVGTFELNLPEGSGSALAANGKLCQASRTVTVAKRVKIRVHGRVRTVTRRVKQKVGLVMPTALTAQNGAVIHQNTPIRVTGCEKAKPAKKTKAKKAKQARKKK
jgi:hypothetical protein